MNREVRAQEKALASHFGFDIVTSEDEDCFSFSRPDRVSKSEDASQDENTVHPPTMKEPLPWGPINEPRDPKGKHSGSFNRRH